MTILVSGGGTGGHITPLLAVAHELKLADPACKIIYVGERGGKFKSLVESDDSIDQCFYVSAGKFRRYHGDTWLRKLTDIKTFILNVRDFFRFLAGTAQSLKLIRKTKPDVVFIKGGFVGVPVGLAATRRGVPIITHDSDTTPGLANRILAKRAALHATGMPAELYSYPKDKTRYTGVPVSTDFKPVVETELGSLRDSLHVARSAKVILVTGGSQGARRLNSVVSSQYDALLDLSQDVYIIHQVGPGNLPENSNTPQNERLQIVEFLTNLAQYMALADVVICRASATTLAELGVLSKAAIVVPSPFLAGGHQVKNAHYLKNKKAAIVLDEDQISNQPSILTTAVSEILNDKSKRDELAKNLHAVIKPDAAIQLAHILLGYKDRT